MSEHGAENYAPVVGCPMCRERGSRCNRHDAENDMTVQWAHVLDEDGSADLYDTEAEARSMLALMGGGLERIESTVVVPFRPIPPEGTAR